MSGRIHFDNTTQYCQTTDVARFFEQYDDFTSSTNPTGSDVDEKILERSEYIDRQTGHAWRPNTVKEEIHDLQGPYYWWSGIPVQLGKRDVRDLDSASGDKLEMWDGSSWNDWLTDSSKSQGRNNDYWMDNNAGILYIHRRFIFSRHPRMRVTYRYGHPAGVQKQIQHACAKLVAADLAESDQYSMNIPGTDGAIDPQTASERWRDDAERIIEERTEVAYVEPY